MKQNGRYRIRQAVIVAPSRERGLKLCSYWTFLQQRWVAPSRERGLKPCIAIPDPVGPSVAPSRERGLKLFIPSIPVTYGTVAPSRERGLKQRKGIELDRMYKGRSFTGAWIETGLL